MRRKTASKCVVVRLEARPALLSGKGREPPVAGVAPVYGIWYIQVQDQGGEPIAGALAAAAADR